MVAASISADEIASQPNIEFDPWPWAIIVSLICLLPLLLMAVGVDFSTRLSPLTPGALDRLTQAQLGDAIQASVRGNYTHTLLEWTATTSAVFLVALAFMQYRLTRESSLPIIGIALVCAGAMDAFHTLAADRLISAVAPNKDLIPFTWAICRMFNAMIQMVGVGIVVVWMRGEKSQIGPVAISVIGGGFVLAAYAIVSWCANSATLPQTMFPDAAVKRPFDLYPIAPYLISAIVLFPMYLRRNRNVFAYMLLIALIPDIATELYMAFGSTSLHDSAFNVAHALKAFSYMVPVAGLFIDYVRTYAEQQRLSDEREELVFGLRAKGRELEAAVREAERANQVKTEFLANMSHELRTPMNSIMGFTKRLIKRLDGQVGEREMDALQTVDRNAKHLLVLINDILDLSKIEAGRMEVDYSRFSVSPLVNEVTEQLRPLATDKGLHLTFSAAAVDDSIRSDRTKISQIVRNLMSNAIKYTDSGRIDVSVAAATHPGLGAVVRISVRDTGVGIKSKDQTRLFERFTQLDSSTKRKAGGTGLGLVITKRYCEMLGGQLSFDSEFGHGSEFTAILPVSPRLDEARLAEPSQTTASLEITTNARQTGSYDTDRLTVLCVDDEPDILKLLGLMLSDVGFEVQAATSFDQALEIARTTPPDLVCLDLHLPSRDGYEILQEFRRDSQLREIPIVIVSGVADEAKEFGCGADAYLSKPVDDEHLIGAVRGVLAARVESVLLLEDDVDAARLLAAEFHDVGIDVHVAHNGWQGAELLASAPPDVVVLDLGMPEMDGFEFLEQLKSNPQLTQIPVVVVTGRDIDSDECAKLSRHGVSILTKASIENSGVVETVAIASAIARRGRTNA